MPDSIPLLLFAKAPIPGKVKTRLCSDCSEQQAAEIAKRLMQASIQVVLESWPGPVFLSVWLDQDHPFFESMRSRYPIAMTPQCDGDLGEKMRDALHTYGYPAAVMGCDAPHVSPDALKKAYDALSQGHSVIGPSEDGGYYLLGLSQEANALFTDMPWGQSDVLSRTLSSANDIGLELKRLDGLNDIDEWSDLISAIELLPDLKQYLLGEHLIEN